MDAKHLFDWIVGSWKFERTIDPLANAIGSAEIARVSQGEALYCERADVVLRSGERVHGTQSYLYRQTDAGFDVFFAETGELFESLRFASEGSNFIAAAMHDCSRDRYESQYVLYPDDRMLIRHAVRGPAKDYVSETRYRRVG